MSVRIWEVSENSVRKYSFNFKIPLRKDSCCTDGLAGKNP